MIYTIGHTESYMRSHKRSKYLGKPFYKIGRTEYYPGGSVWKTKGEAKQHCDASRSVFGVIADWEEDTAPSIIGDWHDLLVNADIVVLEHT